MKPLSIIITVLNDQEEANATIKSIRDTAGMEPEIVVIDDASNNELVLEDKQTILERNTTRRGVGGARHQAAALSTGQQLLITDSHMRFEPGWYEKAMNTIIDKPTTLWCGCCLGLGDGFMDLAKHKGAYNGATLCLYNKENGEILEGKWIADKPDQDNYELACIMGAIYFIPKEFYNKLLGLGDLRGWGSDEPFLSAKVWLSGGDIRMLKGVRVGHKFRNVAPYSTWSPLMVYNKLMVLYTVFGDEVYNKLATKFPDNGDVKAAKAMFESEKPFMDNRRKYYQSIFVRSAQMYLDKFQIRYD